MKEPEIRDSNITSVLEPDEGETFAGISLRKLTPASLSLCEMIDLKVVTSQEDSQHTNFEILCFLWIHSRPAKEARLAIFDQTEGKDESTGRTFALINAVLDWAEEIAFTQFQEAAKRIASLLEASFSGMVEPIEDTDAKSGGKAKKKAKARGVS